jgi:hypothetical protein
VFGPRKWFLVFCSWFLPPSYLDSTSPWSPLAPSCAFCLAISIFTSGQQSAAKTSLSVAASFAEFRLPVRFVLWTIVRVESDLQQPPVLASETFLLPVPLAPVLSLFPGGAMQHELLRFSGRCSPLPSSVLSACLSLGSVQQLIRSWFPLSSRQTL